MEKKFIHKLNTDVNGVAEWAIIFYTIFPLVGFIASLVYLMKSARKSPYFNAGMDRAYHL
ncbi:hypothetical protein E4T70_04340 [Lactobacillus johnsonii]|nr:hypothetical protein [Lactobacillus johnsonii]TFU79879.1 hypothetical protein E4T70_04340 [Lactobacillus johnsonii]